MARNPGKHDIDANPTRALFINMLTKDISLDSAIIDLVDNSVDAARERSTEDSLVDFQVKLDVSPKSFKISDNCGGMTVDTARRYAFKFGRPVDIDPEDKSIGRFGVGMKRTLFKLGRKFQVESRTATEHFVVKLDVEEWGKKTENDWGFDFDEVEENLDEVPEGERGLTIVVDDLYSSVSEQFGNSSFLQSLREDIRSAHRLSIERGLEIYLNGDRLKRDRLQFRESELIKTWYKRVVFEADSEKPLIVEIYAGIGESVPTKAGWYIFCNSRLVLEADQSNVTGWQERVADKVPRYHNQYARFRGICSFECDDPKKLPYNTTKTGVDVENPAFRAVRREMINMMVPVLQFLNDLDKESDQQEQPLRQAVEEAKPIFLNAISTSRQTFVRPPAVEAAEKTKLTRISYQKPRKEVDEIKEAAGIGSNYEVGEMTFEYYREMELEN